MFRGLAVLVFTAPLFAQNPAAIPAFPAASEPQCDAGSRGKVILSLGEKGQADLLKICARDGLGHFAWAVSGRQNTNTFAQTRFVGGCPLFPDDNVWNSRVDSLPLDANSSLITGNFRDVTLGVDISMSLNLADAATPTPQLTLSSDESDHGLYALTPDMKVEGYVFHGSRPVSGGPYPGDAHLLVLRTDQCKLYELFGLRSAQAPYAAESGAIFNLLANDLRPDGWTSADAAGLPIWPGVVTYAELFGEGEIRHMIRFTVDKSRRAYVWPGRHFASRNESPALPPMGSRWRLKADFDGKTCHAGGRSGKVFPPEMLRLIAALKNYGMILADNGRSILLTSDSDPRWGDPAALDSPVAIVNDWTHCITGKDFEVVSGADAMISARSAAAAK